MQSISDKQRFVSTLVKNVQYFNSDIVIAHVNAFLRANQSFGAREAIRKANNDEFFSFLEIAGFIQIGKSFSEMYIGIPKTYPTQPPMFLLNINRQCSYVNNEDHLLKNNLIAFEFNENKEEFIRLRHPMVESQWNPSSKPTLIGTFQNLMKAINNPPLIGDISERQQYNDPRKSARKPAYNNSNNNNQHKPIKSQQINLMVENLEADGLNLLISKETLAATNDELDYSVCREKFMEEHLEELKFYLKQKENQIVGATERLEEKKLTINQNYNCDELIEMDGKEGEKLEMMSEQQALKEAEVALRAKVEKNENASFGQYKKIMKVLYDRMFDNQSRLLLKGK